MSPRRKKTRRPSRRALLRHGLATAAAAMTLHALQAGAVGDEVRLQRYDRVEAEKYPFGWIRWLMSGQIDPRAEMTMGVVHFEPNQTNVLHIHPNSAEYLYVLSGSSEHLIDGKWVTLKTGDSLRIPRGIPHQARTRDEAFEALIVYDTPTRIMVPVNATPSP
jgi:quercetin dioxygenase-like cupin family protein